MARGVAYSEKYDDWSKGYPPDWGERREKVLNRDNYRCQSCEEKFVPENQVKLDVDHEIPKSDGGSHSLDNLQVLCRQCHSAKHPNNRKLSRRADRSSDLITVFLLWFLRLVFREDGGTEEALIEVQGISNISIAYERAHLAAEVDQLWTPNNDAIQQVGLLRNNDEVMKFISWKQDDVNQVREGKIYRIEYASIENYKGKYDGNTQLKLDNYTEIEPI